MKSTAGLYVHIPYCEKRCAYCTFYACTDQPVAENRYRAALRDHLDQFPDTGDRRFDTIYVGGGTPSRMPVSFFRRLLSDLQLRLNWTGSLEYSVELNPEHGRTAYLADLADSGVNRLSIGIQSLDDRILSKLGRIHNAETARKTVSAASKCFEQVSVDFMIGIRDQTSRPDRLIPSEILDYVHHVSVYMLEGERNRSWMDADDRTSDIYLTVCEYLESAGFNQYEISNFARPGYQCVHNLHYWQGDPYIGIGPSAHSLWNDRRIATAPDLEDFLAGDPGKTAESCPPPTLMKEVMMLSLRKRAGADRNWFRKRFGVDIFREFSGLDERFPVLVIKTENGFQLSRAGMLVSNEIFESVLFGD